MKDLSNAGKHDFDLPAGYWFTGYNNSTFSFGLFKLVPSKDGSKLKKSAALVRIKCNVGITKKEHCITAGMNIVKLLDAGEWDGRKNVKIEEFL